MESLPEAIGDLYVSDELEVLALANEWQDVNGKM
jgi:hypothetical protein